MRYLVSIAGLCVLSLLFATACAPTTQTVKLYDDPTAAQKVYRRLLVVDISTDPNQQQSFEDELVRTSRVENVEGIASHPTLAFSHGVMQDQLDTLSEDVRADGILLTHIASVDTSVKVEEGREKLVSTCRGGDLVDYFLYDHKLIKEPDTVKLAHTVVVVSNLYDVETRQRVWTIQSTCFKKSSMSEVLLDEAEAIVRQLRIDELI